jgi:molybdopterin synthase catalytic subunit
MAIWKSIILITNEPLPEPSHRWEDSAGAVLDFWGVVRSREDGRLISGIEYEAHPAMAQHQMEMIAQTARAEFELGEIILRHRVGFVAAGEASLFLRVTSAHRGAAFAASQWMISQLKKKVPIWKRPLFVSPTAPPPAAEEAPQPVPARE